MNLNAVLKSFPFCSEIMPLVEKLAAFEGWEKYMKKETYEGLAEKCREI